jgi:hypothetical protein
MFFKKDPEELLREQEKKLEQLEENNNKLNEDLRNLFQEFNVTPEQLYSFANNPENFTKENWEEMQKEKQKLDAKLQLDLDNIRNLKKTKQSYSDRRIGQHWIFVR